MFEHIIDIIAPHHCVGCAKQGKLLCVHCEADILDESLGLCYACGKPTSLTGICGDCASTSPLDGIWVTGEYSDALKQLIKAYKFERARAANRVLVNLLDSTIPTKFTTDIVVSIPTIAAHQRIRGYDHAALLAKGLSSRRGIERAYPLKRIANYQQRGAGRTARKAQADKMFADIGMPLNGLSVLLVDDVITTGSTLRAAAVKIKAAGADRVYGAACAYERLKR